MRIGIVGAGMAGLAAARTLRKAGHDIVIFEKSRGFGGRAATRRIGPYTFDTGATVISPGEGHLHRAMIDELPKGELVRIEKPIFLHSFGRITPVDPQHNRVVRYAYQSGITTLGKLLAEGMDVRLESPVETVEKSNGEYVIHGEKFDGVVLTPPIPQTCEILEKMGEKRPLTGVKYRQCLSVMVGYDKPIDKPFHALIDPDQSEPLTWLSIENIKVPGDFRAPAGHTAIVAQMSARYSRYRFEDSDETIIKETLVDVSRILGKEFRTPVEQGVMRWKFSHASNTVAFDTANPRGSRLVVASDGLVGGRLHQAYDIGVKAAELLIDSF
ncbi:MAG: FAD-dependent oxidoreductase [Armatimonadetes bacterium]|nr:FAD-dependent oxidoreductase [Armatimonadota bacterium]